MLYYTAVNTIFYYTEVSVVMSIALLNFFIFFFCLTSFFSICFALVIFFADNTIYSALSLIGLFFCSFVLLILIKAEFLAIIYLMLYIGAVAVIFLFAVMFIDLRLEDTWVDTSYTKNYGITLIIFFKLLFSLQLILSGVDFLSYNDFLLWNDEVFMQVGIVYKLNYFFADILCITNLLYTHYLLYLVLLSLILWGVMLGSISICVRYK